MSSVRITLPALHEKQQIVRDDPTRFKVLVAGRRFGKNVVMHDYTVAGVLDGWQVGFGSPTYKNMTRDWDTLKEILAPVTTRALEQERRIECITGGALEMWTLDNPEPIRGRSYHRFVINEAGFVPYLLNTWRLIIRPTLFDFKGDALIGGTPNGMNDYHTIYGWGLGGDPDWKSFHFTSFDNPYIDPAEIESQGDATEMQYRQEVLAEFVQTAGAVFRNLDAALTAPQQDPIEHEGHTIVGGADWGKSNDYTVLSLGCCECRREVAIDRFNQIDYAFQVDRLEMLHKRWHVKRWRVELNSIGTPVFEQVQRRGIPASGFTTTLASKAPLIEGMALGLERGELQLLPDDVGRAELQAYEVKRTESGASKYGAPDGMHDDTVIARCLMYAQMRDTPVIDLVRKRKHDQAFDLARKVL